MQRIGAAMRGDSGLQRSEYTDKKKESASKAVANGNTSEGRAP